MKKLFLIVAACFALVALVLVLNTSGANACFARWSCGDAVVLVGPSELCVNNALMTVKPTSESAVYIHVPGDAQVSSDPTTCGGTVSAMAISADKVIKDSDKHVVKIGVLSDPSTTISFTYYGQDATVTTDETGAAWVKFNTK